MPTVFPLDPHYSLTHEIAMINFVAEMGDGFEQRVNKNLAYTRADGEGGVTSYKGRNKFNVTLPRMKHANLDANQEANKLWAFYKARLGSFESFYFYNPAEGARDDTGTATTGRYLVRFEENNLSRELFRLRLYSSGVRMIEVRS